jgi:signal peptidase I
LARGRGMLRGFTREFLIPIGLALIFIQFVIQAFKIPSASMEDSLLVGDFLLGLKFVYGSPVPFTHSRLPSLTEPKPGDVIIFRYPGDPSHPEGKPERYRFLANLFLFGNLYWDRRPGPGQNRLVWYAPKDFIKRCVAQSGQTLTVSGTRLLVDGVEKRLPPKGRYRAGREPDPIRDSLHFRLPAPGEILDFDTLSLTQAVWIRSLAVQENPGRRVELELDLVRDSAVDNDYILPYLNGRGSNPNHQAALYYLGVPLSRREHAGEEYWHAEHVPFQRIRQVARTGFIRATDFVPPEFRSRGGKREELNEYYMGNYLELIARNIREQGREAGREYRVRASLVVDGQRATRYTVRKPCYFMMGDNRDNSSDSRYWGLLSRNNVKAKAFIIYFSLADDAGDIRLKNPFTWLAIPLKTRWTRLGKLID